MRQFIFALIAILGQTSVNVALPLSANYTILRRQILAYEQQMAIGGNLTLNDFEQVANDVLMTAKKEELDAAFRKPELFAPSQNFLMAKKQIDNSKVFQFLRRMPKGAVLHAHDTSLVAIDYLYHNITFRDDLYICDEDEVFRLQFFHKPDDTCQWELLKDVRQNPQRGIGVDERIKERLTMGCDDPDNKYANIDAAWSKFQGIFTFINPLVTYRPVYEDHFLKALEELYEDNVIYLELRSTLPTLYDFEGTEYKPSDIVGIYKELSERFKEDHPDFIGVKLIYAPQRSADHKQAEGYMKTMKELQELYPNFVAGFDLVGREDEGHTLEYFSDIILNSNPSINFFFHTGETNWYGSSTDENLVDAILMNTRRIGHGYALAYHPILLEMVRRLNIAIEVNPISNQVLKLVDDLRNHAARRLFAEGYPVVISNDDPGFWGARALSYDFYEAFMALMSEHSDMKALKQLAINSLSYSSLNDEEKEDAMALWEMKWDRFVEEVVKDARQKRG
ncbi:adenosine deaminase [Calliopsis andreniformis]|uniref:adenosine deaminase n=1 Tax=Calliopsis andreniformis TaxID=337506 RepID=UPI003FCE8B0D